MTPLPLLLQALAVTVCEAGQPVTHYSPGIPAPLRAEIEVHEARHRRQMAVGCDSVLAVARADVLVRAQFEAEASCDQVQYVLAATPLDPEGRPRSKRAMVLYAAAAFLRLFGGPPDRVVTIFLAACP